MLRKNSAHILFIVERSNQRLGGNRFRNTGAGTRRLTGQTESMTLYVQDRYRSFDDVGTYASSVLLALLAMLTLILMTRLRPKEETQ